MITNNDLFKKFYEDISEGYAPGSLQLISIHVRDLLSFLGDKSIKEITLDDLELWQSYLIKRGLKKATIRNKLNLVNIFLSYCTEEGFLKENPLQYIRKINLDTPNPKYLKLSELIALMEAAKKDIMYRTIIELLFATGVRVSELVNLKKEDIDFDEKIICIDKSKNSSEDYVPFSSRAEIWLKKYLLMRADNNPYLFISRRGKPLSRNTVLKKLNYYGKIANLPIQVSPHLLRRTLATYLASKDVSTEFIMRLLRHRHRYSIQSYVSLKEVTKKDFNGYLY